MSDHSNLRLPLRFASFSSKAGIGIFLTGVLVLTGWWFDLPVVKSLHPHLLSMKANTALCFALSGVALWLLQSKRAGQRTHRRFAQACALGVVAVGLLTLLEFVFHVNLGIDQLLFSEAPGAVLTVYPGRMFPITALIFLLVGLAFLLLDVETRRGIRPAQFLILLGGMLSLLGFFGYLYGSFIFFGSTFPFVVMAAPTAMAFLALCAGMLAARPDRGLMLLVTSDRPGGYMLRRLLLAVLVLPVSFDLLTLPGEKAGYYNSLTQAAVQGLMVIVAFTVIVYWVSRSLARAEEQLRKLSRAVEQSPASIVITNLHGEIEYVNAKFTDLTGYSRAEAIGQNPRILSTGELPPEAYRRLWETITTGHEWQGEFHNKKKNGDLYWEFARISPITNEAGRITHFLAVKEDITPRKAAEAALRNSEERLQLATGAARIGIWDWDVVKNELVWDDSMYRLYGIRREDFTGAYEAWIRCVHPDDVKRTDDAIQAAIHGEKEYAPEFRIVRPDGSIHFIQAASQTFRDKDGKTVRMIGTNIDISERKAAEAEREFLIKSLEESLARVKTLSGLIPICASCKKIRDDKGYWSQVEIYVSQHSEAKFSHGICPDCVRKLYPDLYGDQPPA